MFTVGIDMMGSDICGGLLDKIGSAKGENEEEEEEGGKELEFVRRQVCKWEVALQRRALLATTTTTYCRSFHEQVQKMHRNKTGQAQLTASL